MDAQRCSKRIQNRLLTLPLTVATPKVNESFAAFLCFLSQMEFDGIKYSMGQRFIKACKGLFFSHVSLLNMFSVTPLPSRLDVGFLTPKSPPGAVEESFHPAHLPVFILRTSSTTPGPQLCNRRQKQPEITVNRCE